MTARKWGWQRRFWKRARQSAGRVTAANVAARKALAKLNVGGVR